LSNYHIKVLGVTQDGGYPHPGCYQKCCAKAWSNKNSKKLISCLAIIDKNSKKFWLIDITPDFKEQLNMLDPSFSLEGIFLTHAHIGHYIGLVDLGLEVMNLKNVKVYSMPKMKCFLEENAPINFLIDKKNINPIQILENNSINLNKELKIVPFLVPHRNELSETVGYKIISNKKSIIYLPDIDSWEEWEVDVLDFIKENDLLFLDGTFCNKNEIKHRNIKKIPHPSVLESMDKFKNLNKSNRKKIYFIHLNHTNNLLRKESKEYKNIYLNGFNVADDGQEVSI
tara:strand:+ start:199 stop:1050 length:852 start_codon:yes stop_codon:yes gene_type:complete